MNPTKKSVKKLEDLLTEIDADALEAVSGGAMQLNCDMNVVQASYDGSGDGGGYGGGDGGYGGGDGGGYGGYDA